MTEQASLFMDAPPVWAEDPIGLRWWRFHRAHPEVGREFIRLAREWRNAQPTTRCGAKAIFEVLRFNHALGLIVRPDESEPFKINNR